MITNEIASSKRVEVFTDCLTKLLKDGEVRKHFFFFFFKLSEITNCFVIEINSQNVVMDVPVSFKKSCMSSILCRTDCQKTGISPDVGALRRLIRDPECRPVLRGIFESLLHYLIHDLLKRTTQNTSQPESSSVLQIHTRNTAEPDLQKDKKTNFQKGVRVVHLRGKMTAERSSNTPEKCKVDQRAGGLICRRLTTFQLLRSKFLRSLPKPFNTNQREVGTLCSSRGVPGRDNPYQNRKYNTDTRDKGLKRRGTVKQIVAKFAMTDQKQPGLKTLIEEPIKPRCIGRGILLNLLMTRFENVATVRKKKDLFLAHKQLSGRDVVASQMKENIAGVEREKQQVGDQTFKKQNPGKSRQCKSVKESKVNQIRREQQQRPDPEADVLTKPNSHAEDEGHLRAESLDQEISFSLNRRKCKAHDMDVEDGTSKQFSQIPTTVHKAEPMERVNFAEIEILPLISVTKWSTPQPCKILPQEEIKVNWQIATIFTCSPAWSECVESFPPKEIKSEISERWEQEKISRENPDDLLGNPECSSSESAGTESEQTEDGAKSKTQTYSLEFANVDVSLQSSKPDQGGFSKCVIPSIYRFGAINSYKSTLHPETITPLTENQLTHSSLIHPGNEASHSLQEIQEKDVCSPHSDSHLAVTTRKSVVGAEAKHQEAIEDVKQSERNNIGKPGSCRRLEETANKDTFADGESSEFLSHRFQPERDNTKPRPKYRTINYADPSVKQTYKPKVIRFTDTFTF